MNGTRDPNKQGEQQQRDDLFAEAIEQMKHR